MKTILIVAAPSPQRDALVSRLETEDYLVVTGGNRAQAIEILQAMVPGAVFVDLSMPRREGRLVAEYLERDPRLRVVPRLVAIASFRKNTRFVAGGGVFVKPLDCEHVVRALRALYPTPRAAAPRPEERRRGLDLLDEGIDTLAS